MCDTTNNRNSNEEIRIELDHFLDYFGKNDSDLGEAVVLLQIPQVPSSEISHDVADNRGYFAYPPQGLLYLSAVCDNLGISSRIVDLNQCVLLAGQSTDRDITAAWQAGVNDAITAFDRPLIAISFMFDSTRGQLNEVMAYIKQIRPELCIIVGGVAASGDPEAILETDHADFVVHNEGERPLAEFIEYVRGNADNVPENISFRGRDGHIYQSTISSGGEVDIDIRNQYARIDIGRYFKAGSLNNFSRMRGIDAPFATVLSRRGCRANCTFCAVRNFNGRSVRVRDVEGVIEEMECLWNDHGIRHFEWLDDDLLYDRERALKLFEEISNRLPDATWCANNGLIAAAIDKQLLEAMQKSGCLGFTVGLETGNPEMLRKVRKPASLARFARFAKLSKQFPKIYYIVNFILGLPDERYGQMLDSLAVGADARLDWINFFTYQPLKNTDAYLAYGGMDLPNDEEVVKRGTTINYNPIRGGAFKDVGGNDDVAMAYDVFDLDSQVVPSRQQVREIWFTFNNICNFLRSPALFTPSHERVRNAVRWLGALQQAYADNPTITCFLYYLNWRLNESSASELGAIKDLARQKFLRHEYWQKRDSAFAISAFLDNDIAPLDRRADQFFKDREIDLTVNPTGEL